MKKVVEIIPMTSARLTQWLPTMWDDYRASLLRAGETPASADENIARNRDTIFDGELPRDNHYFFQIVHSGEEVGVVWVGQRTPEPQSYYVYDIVVHENFRAKGYGRAAMECAEEWVRHRGGTRLALNVFGYNTPARRLYESLGFVELAISMFKDLE